jgi:hypothetical protein
MKYREVHTVVTVSSRIFVFVSLLKCFLVRFSCRRVHGFWDFRVLVFGTVSAREKTSDADVPEFHRSERLTRGPHLVRSQNFSCVEAVKCLVRFCRFVVFFVLSHFSPAPFGWKEGREAGHTGLSQHHDNKGDPSNLLGRLYGVRGRSRYAQFTSQPIRLREKYRCATVMR